MIRPSHEHSRPGPILRSGSTLIAARDHSTATRRLAHNGGAALTPALRVPNYSFPLRYTSLPFSMSFSACLGPQRSVTRNCLFCI